MNKKISSPQSAFTIVELLVVIVIIGILAAITIVSYTGITQKATAASLQADLANASQKLKIFQLREDNPSGNFPATLNCAIPDSATNLCLKTSGANNIDPATGYTFNNDVVPKTFTLRATNGPTAYVVTNDAPPVADNGVPQLDMKILASASHTCAISSTSKLYCWGYNQNGQLGNNSILTSLVPVAVDTSGLLNNKTITQVDAGSNHTCALTSENLAYCWGYNSDGRLGDNSTINSLVPVAVYMGGVLNGKTIKSISIGDAANCAIASDDKVYCWGNNTSGELGNNSTTNSSAPVAVDVSGVLGGKNIKYVATGMAHTCAVASDDTIYCWGYNVYGQLGNNSTNNSSVPVAVSMSGVLNGKTIRSISAGGYSNCVVASDNKVYCWGANWAGQIGDNSSDAKSVPVAVDTSGVLNNKTVTSVSAGYYSTCVLTSENLAYCWGADNYGQLGNNSTASSLVPVTVSMGGGLNGKTLKSISIATSHTCAIANDNKAYCWGQNQEEPMMPWEELIIHGKLGNNSADNSLIPVAVNDFPS